MIFCHRSICDFEGDSIEISTELAIILGHYFSVTEERLGTEEAKFAFEATLKTAMNLKETREKENGKDET